MWCNAGGDQTHIGSPAWFQLNQANPEPHDIQKKIPTFLLLLVVPAKISTVRRRVRSQQTEDAAFLWKAPVQSGFKRGHWAKAMRSQSDDSARAS